MGYLWKLKGDTWVKVKIKKSLSFWLRKQLGPTIINLNFNAKRDEKLTNDVNMYILGVMIQMTIV